MRRSSLTRGGFVLAAASLAACPVVAQEGGVLLTFGIEQRLESGWNLGLAVPREGRTTASVTRLSFGLTSETALDRLEFSASTALVVEDSFDTSGTSVELGRPELILRYTREVPNAIFSIAAQFRRDDVDAFDVDLDEDDADGTRTDYGVELRFETGRTAPLGFAFTTAVERSEYDDTTDPDLIDTNTLRVGAETLLRFSEVATGRIGLGYEREDEDIVGGSVLETMSVSAGLDYALPNGLMTAALTMRRDDQDRERTDLVIGRSLELPAGALSGRLGVSFANPGGSDLIGALEWSQELPSGSVDVSLERTVDFDDATDDSATDTIFSVNLAQDINAVSSLGLEFSHEVSLSPTERIEQTEVAATYRYLLTEDWGLDSGVGYRVRTDADGRAESPNIFVALNRTFEIRP
jgi:hypothetical protein